MSAVLDAKKDFSDELQVAINESLTIAEDRGLGESINQLLLFEKKCRVYNDYKNLKEICLHMARLCRSKNDWERLNSTLTVISKRRGQSKIAISAIVEEAFKYVDETPSQDIKVALITTLKDICEGKIYVEAESAKLHLLLSQILEAKGDIGGACDMIQDVHVETYGSLDKKEKAEYILHQIRINLVRKDYIRALIQSRKMNRKLLDTEGFDEVKISYYRMMVEYHTHEHECWDIAQCYYKIYDTSLIKQDIDKKQEALQSAIVFLLLSKHDNHQVDMLHRLCALKDLDSVPVFKDILTLFSRKEIIGTPFLNQEVFESHPSLDAFGGAASKAFYINAFHTRVIEHNLRVCAAYYKRISTKRLSELLSLSLDDLERHLGELSTSGDAYVKIDRPIGIVCFRAPRQPEAVLSDWSSDIGKLLTLMETTCHLINRENMVHKM